MQQRILIEGIGGIGGVIAAKMIEAGHHPVLITHNPTITQTIRDSGIRATTSDGDTQGSPEVYSVLGDVPKDTPFDAALLIMKANSVVQAATETIPRLTPQGFVVTFQNGVVEDAVSEAVGPQRTVSGIIGWGGTMHAPGFYEKTSSGNTYLGELDGSVSDRVKLLADTLTCAAPVVVSSNIRGALWSKLAINCTITTIGGLTGETLGEMLRDGRTRLALLKTYSEVIDTAEALGIRLERIAADPKVLYIPKNAGSLKRLQKDIVARFIGRKYRKLRSSMLQSIERGRKTEIDFLNGYVVDKAKETHTPTPLNSALVKMIKEIELGVRPMSMKNILQLQSYV